jgi:hypothetical protein
MLVSTVMCQWQEKKLSARYQAYLTEHDMLTLHVGQVFHWSIKRVGSHRLVGNETEDAPVLVGERQWTSSEGKMVET